MHVRSQTLKDSFDKRSRHMGKRFTYIVKRLHRETLLLKCQALISEATLQKQEENIELHQYSASLSSSAENKLIC